MRHVLLASIIGLAVRCAADDPSTNRVREFVLDNRPVIRIPVARDRITTVRFPSAISDLEGLFIATEVEPGILFQYNFRPGSPFFSVRAISTNAAVNLNVVWKDRTYALELIESTQPWYAVNFVVSNPPPVRPTASPAPAGPKPLAAVPLPSTLTTNQIAELLGIARRLTQYPQITPGVDHRQPRYRWQFRDYDLELRDVILFQAQDTIVVNAVVRNKTQWSLYYYPQVLGLFVTNQTWGMSVTDGTGWVQPWTEDSVFFAVTGGLSQAPKGLTLNNAFGLSFNYQLFDTSSYRKKSWLRRLFD